MWYEQMGNTLNHNEIWKHTKISFAMISYSTDIFHQCRPNKKHTHTHKHTKKKHTLSTPPQKKKKKTSWWFFTNPSEKICKSQIGSSPQGSGWTFQKYLSFHHPNKNPEKNGPKTFAPRFNASTSPSKSFNCNKVKWRKPPRLEKMRRGYFPKTPLKGGVGRIWCGPFRCDLLGVVEFCMVNVMAFIGVY